MKGRFSLAPFRRLQWKLTLSYTAVTVGALLAVELLLFVAIVLFLGSDIVTNLALESLRENVVPGARPYFAGEEPDIPGLQTYAGTLVETTTQIGINGVEETSALRFGSLRLESDAQELHFLNSSLQLLATAPPTEDGGPWPRPFDMQSVPGAAGVVANALQNQTSAEALYANPASGISVIALPITGEDGRVAGIVLLSFAIPLFESGTIIPIVQTILITLIPLTLGAGVIGTLFGFLTARGLTRRLGQISAAANAWSSGDFSVVNNDPSGDELGQLNRTLTRMAEQLQNLLATRQELAMLEERNRLAQELHDTVKQQVFATVMQLNAAKALVEANPAAAKTHIAEAETLARQSQLELTGLIQELRPAALEGKGLVDAVRELTVDWSRRTGISAAVHSQGERPLPLPTEQSLFRIVQEALANVARHSGAAEVVIRFVWQNDGLELTIRDDGCGFDVPAVSGAGIGLPGMRERIAALGGGLSISAAAGEGTIILASLPVEGNETAIREGIE